jgi:hypothetical protein
MASHVINDFQFFDIRLEVLCPENSHYFRVYYKRCFLCSIRRTESRLYFICEISVKIEGMLIIKEALDLLKKAEGEKADEQR